MMRYLFASLAVVASVGLVGCGLSPQYLTPEPRFTGQLMKVGQGQPVVVRVSDARTSQVIGTRGGLYAQSSAITVNSQAFLPRLQAETDAAVRMLGFTPMQQGAGEAQLNLKLIGLSYKSVAGGGVIKDAQLNAVYALEVQNGTRRYNGRYAANLTQGYAKAPNEQTNNELVSKVLSEGLQRVFNDPAIGQLLAQ